MANSYHRIYIHSVFVVKYREAIIGKSMKEDLMKVIANLINETGDLLSLKKVYHSATVATPRCTSMCAWAWISSGRGVARTACRSCSTRTGMTDSRFSVIPGLKA